MAVTEKCDVYSFGVLVLEVLMGTHPGEVISSMNSSSLGQGIKLEDVLDHRLSFPVNQKIEDDLNAILKLSQLCLCADPKTRPTMHDVSLLLEIRTGHN
ncbi:unnamed protein product [Ilex paraguariensis]